MLKVEKKHVGRDLTIEALYGNLDDTQGASYILRLEADMLILTSRQMEALIRRLEEALNGA